MREQQTISAGKWILTEGGTPVYTVYKLIKGTVSIHKSGRKIRETTIADGAAPIMMGVTALLRADRLHMASIKAETDVVVEPIYVDHVLGVLKNELPKEKKAELAHMMEAITTGNEIISLVHKYWDIPRVNLEIPSGMEKETEEILDEIQRLYAVITHDVDHISYAEP
ncbi:MAG: hypothetical protein OEV92_01600 [Nitrospinota bacterium]|nr:hypothetical protein [Nitrospinota bacterium]